MSIPSAGSRVHGDELRSAASVTNDRGLGAACSLAEECDTDLLADLPIPSPGASCGMERPHSSLATPSTDFGATPTATPSLHNSTPSRPSETPSSGPLVPGARLVDTLRPASLPAQADEKEDNQEERPARPKSQMAKAATPWAMTPWSPVPQPLNVASGVRRPFIRRASFPACTSALVAGTEPRLAQSRCAGKETPEACALSAASGTGAVHDAVASSSERESTLCAQLAARQFIAGIVLGVVLGKTVNDTGDVTAAPHGVASPNTLQENLDGTCHRPSDFKENIDTESRRVCDQEVHDVAPRREDDPPREDPFDMELLDCALGLEVTSPAEDAATPCISVITAPDDPTTPLNLGFPDDELSMQQTLSDQPGRRNKRAATHTTQSVVPHSLQLGELASRQHQVRRASTWPLDWHSNEDADPTDRSEYSGTLELKTVTLESTHSNTEMASEDVIEEDESANSTKVSDASNKPGVKTQTTKRPDRARRRASTGVEPKKNLRSPREPKARPKADFASKGGQAAQSTRTSVQGKDNKRPWTKIKSNPQAQPDERDHTSFNDDLVKTELEYDEAGPVETPWEPEGPSDVEVLRQYQEVASHQQAAGDLPSQADLNSGCYGYYVLDAQGNNNFYPGHPGRFDYTGSTISDFADVQFASQIELQSSILDLSQYVIPEKTQHHMYTTDPAVAQPGIFVSMEPSLYNHGALPRDLEATMSSEEFLQLLSGFNVDCSTAAAMYAAAGGGAQPFSMDAWGTAELSANIGESAPWGNQWPAHDQFEGSEELVAAVDEDIDEGWKHSSSDSIGVEAPAPLGRQIDEKPWQEHISKGRWRHRKKVEKDLIVVRSQEASSGAHERNSPAALLDPGATSTLQVNSVDLLRGLRSEANDHPQRAATPQLPQRPSSRPSPQRRPRSVMDMHELGASRLQSPARSAMHEQDAELHRPKWDTSFYSVHQRRIPTYDALIDEHCTILNSPERLKHLVKTRELHDDYLYLVRSRFEQHQKHFSRDRQPFEGSRSGGALDLQTTKRQTALIACSPDWCNSALHTMCLRNRQVHTDIDGISEAELADVCQDIPSRWEYLRDRVQKLWEVLRIPEIVRHAVRNTSLGSVSPSSLHHLEMHHQHLSEYFTKTKELVTQWLERETLLKRVQRAHALGVNDKRLSQLRADLHEFDGMSQGLLTAMAAWSRKFSDIAMDTTKASYLPMHRACPEHGQSTLAAPGPAWHRRTHWDLGRLRGLLHALSSSGLAETAWIAFAGMARH